MTAAEDVRFRLALATKLLARAQDELGRLQWREAALFARAAIENAAKAVVACFAAIPRIHEPSALLAAAIGDPRFPQDCGDTARSLVPRLAGYGMAEHVLLSNGDERNRIDPWSLVTEEHAQEVMAAAQDTLALARSVAETTVGADG